MNLKFSRFTLAVFILSLSFCTSCSNNDLIGEYDYSSETDGEPVAINKDSAKVYFAKILSKAVYERKDVRDF